MQEDNRNEKQEYDCRFEETTQRELEKNKKD